MRIWNHSQKASSTLHKKSFTHSFISYPADCDDSVDEDEDDDDGWGWWVHEDPIQSRAMATTASDFILFHSIWNVLNYNGIAINNKKGGRKDRIGNWKESNQKANECYLVYIGPCDLLLLLLRLPSMN